MSALTLAQTLYDERLTNDQRLVISKVMSPERKIQTASIGGHQNRQLYLTLRNGRSYRVDPNGNTWAL